MTEKNSLGIMPIFDEHEFNVEHIPIDFIKDNTISIPTFNCSWCGEETNDVHMVLDEDLHLCVECIVKVLDSVLVPHGLKENENND